MEAEATQVGFGMQHVTTRLNVSPKPPCNTSHTLMESQVLKPITRKTHHAHHLGPAEAGKENRKHELAYRTLTHASAMYRHVPSHSPYAPWLQRSAARMMVCSWETQQPSVGGLPAWLPASGKTMSHATRRRLLPPPLQRA